MDRSYTKNTELDEFTQTFIQKLVDADRGDNPDLKVEFRGYRHDNQGFTILFHNMEIYTNDLVQEWEKIADVSGMSCTVENDLVNGWVIVKCQQILRRRIRPPAPTTHKAFKMPPSKTLIYISICIICIYFLWKRHSDQLLL